jgi:large subunit ribosomal protein L23
MFMAEKDDVKAKEAKSEQAAKETKPAKEKKAKKEKPARVKKQKPERKVVLDKTIDPFETVQFVLMTEKCVRMIESQNKLVFVVRRTADKKKIKKAIENAFQSPIESVTTMIDQRGRKRAFVRFSNAGAAGDIAIKLGII